MNYKVLNINNFHYARGGADNYFLQLTELLTDFGHKIKTFSSSQGEIEHPEYLAIEPVKGVDTERGTLNNVFNFHYSREAKQKLQLALNEFQPDIIHLHIYYGQLTGSILPVIKKSNIPVVQTLHEYKLVCPTHGLFAGGKFCDACKGKHYWRAIQKKCNRGSALRSFISATEAYLSEYLGAKDAINQFIAVSEYQKARLVNLGIKAESISVIPHFQDVDSDTKVKKGSYFFYAGRIHENKGLKILLQAYAKINRPLLPLKIAGNLRDRDYWLNYSKKLGIEDNVEWLGYINPEDLKELYQNALVTVNPSLLNETFGLSCLESLASGTPVIASDVGAFSEVISDGEDGILYQPLDIEELSSILKDIEAEKFDIVEMGKNAQIKVQNIFNRQKHYQALKSVYDSVIKPG